MLLPLSDVNGRTNFPVVTIGLILACLAAFVYQLQISGFTAEEVLIYQAQFSAPSNGSLFDRFAFIPQRFFDDPLSGDDPQAVAILTSMFLHGGFLHFIGNMLFLWIFGDNVEDEMGLGRFLIFYLVCGVAAALTQGYMSPDSDVPMIGASGAISGVLGAYLFLHPSARIMTLSPVGIIYVPAYFFLGLYMVAQIVYALQMPAGEPGVAFWAHIGGFVAGAVLHRIFMLGR